MLLNDTRNSRGDAERAYENASLRFNAGDYAGALQLLLPLVAAYGENVDFVYAAGLCYLRLNKPEDASTCAVRLHNLGDRRAKDLNQKIEHLSKELRPSFLFKIRNTAYLLFPVLLIAVAVVMAAPELFWERELAFPEQESAGILYGEPMPPMPESEAVMLGAAQGTVYVPRGVRVSLEARGDTRLDLVPPEAAAWIREVTIDRPSDRSVIAVSDWPRLEKLTLLNAGDLSEESFLGIDGIWHLRALHLDNIALSDGIIEAIARLDRLRELTLSHCTELDSTGLSKLAALRLGTLDLTLPEFGDEELQALAQLRHVESLRLAQTSVSDSGLYSVLPTLTLKELTLVSDWGVGDMTLEALGKMPRLEKLRIEGGQYSVEKIAQLEALESLRVLRILGNTDPTTGGSPDAKVRSVASEVPVDLRTRV